MACHILTIVWHKALFKSELSILDKYQAFQMDEVLGHATIINYDR